MIRDDYVFKEWWGGEGRGNKTFLEEEMVV